MRLQFEENLGEVGTGRCERFRSENLGEAERWERFQTDQENEENQSEWKRYGEENLGREVGRWERFGGGEDEWSGVSRENRENQSAWVTNEETGELDMIMKAGVTVESQNDQHGQPWLKPEYSKAPTRITSKTASPKIFSGRRAATSGWLFSDCSLVPL